jgi:hypothetical protein
MDSEDRMLLSWCVSSESLLDMVSLVELVFLLLVFLKDKELDWEELGELELLREDGEAEGRAG